MEVKIEYLDHWPTYVAESNQTINKIRIRGTFKGVDSTLIHQLDLSLDPEEYGLGEQIQGIIESMEETIASFLLKEFHNE